MKLSKDASLKAGACQQREKIKRRLYWTDTLEFFQPPETRFQQQYHSGCIKNHEYDRIPILQCSYV